MLSTKKDSERDTPMYTSVYNYRKTHVVHVVLVAMRFAALRSVCRPREDDSRGLYTRESQQWACRVQQYKNMHKMGMR